MDISSFVTGFTNLINDYSIGSKVGILILSLLFFCIVSYIVFRLTFLALKVSTVCALIYFIFSLFSINTGEDVEEKHVFMQSKGQVKINSGDLRELVNKVREFLIYSKQTISTQDLMNLLESFNSKTQS